MEENRCYFDICVDDEFVGRVIIQMFRDVAPKAVDNFITLARGDFLDNEGNVREFKGSRIHTIIKNFCILGGDIVNNDGSGNFSIYDGELIEDESFEIKHTRPGLVGLVNAGPNTNGSQFYITLAPCPHMDGKHVIIGKVLQGLDVLYTLQNTPLRNDTPTGNVIIENTSTIDDGVPLNQIGDESLGFPDFPEEPIQNSEFLGVIEHLKSIAGQHFKDGEYHLALREYTKTARYLEYQEYKPNIEEQFAQKVAVYTWMGKINHHLQNYQHCIEACSSALANGRGRADYVALKTRADAFLRLKLMPQAASDFQLIVKLYPKDEEAQRTLARFKRVPMNKGSKGRNRRK